MTFVWISAELFGTMDPSEVKPVEGVVVLEMYCRVLLGEDLAHRLMPKIPAGFECQLAIQAILGNWQMKGFLVKLLTRRHRPLGLVHLWWLFLPVDFECYQDILNRIHVVEPQIGEAANLMNIVRTQVPNIDGSGLRMGHGCDDYFVLDNATLEIFRSRNLLIKSLFCVNIMCCQIVTIGVPVKKSNK